MHRSTRRGIASVSLVSLFALLFLPACDCAGPVSPPTSDGGDSGARSDGGDAARPDGAPTIDVGPIDAGPVTCTPETETCDGTDEDCDGLVDESVVEACGSDEGECVAGTRTCAAGTFGACVGETLPATETCGDGLDEDCDMMIDEGCSCTDGTTQPCGSDVGDCTRGTQTCASSAWGACVGEVGPMAELCDGADNDCDGLDDDLFVDLGMDCDGGDADMCLEGLRVCAADMMSTTCDDTTGDSAEVCGNSTDDDCDGAVDEGCVCTDGMTQPCGSDVGECTAGTQTCTGGAWGACVGGSGPMTELCNMLDDNCDGTSDEGFVTGGMCDGADLDMCTEGVLACDATGGVSCNDTTGDAVETCNTMDDDCDASTDEGFMLGVACDGPDLDLCTEGVNVCNATGGASCNDTTGDAVETCNGIDDDCDGNIDEGNPGGGVICSGSMDVGACIARTACVSGAIVCRGTFVAVGGPATATGASNDPLPSITAAIANAGILGGGADVCVCDTAAAGAATFTENVTMVEGTSVLGGYDCATWTRLGSPAVRTTAVQDTDADGLAFPAGATSVTVLELMTVDGVASADVTTTAAITVTNGSPTLTNVTARAGAAGTAIALRVVETAGATASPTVSGGTYTSIGMAGGTAVAVSLEASSPRFTTTVIGGGGFTSGGGAPPATTAYGVRCVDCAGTTFMLGSVATSGAVTTGYGFHGTGDLAGVTANQTTFSGGPTSAAASHTTGIYLDGCRGAPTFTSTRIRGGSNWPGGPAPLGTVRTALFTQGATCAPVVDGGIHEGCELGQTCYGFDATMSSPLVVRNGANVTGTSGVAEIAGGVRCFSGACASLTSSTISTGVLSPTGTVGIGLEVNGASPTVDDDTITGPMGRNTSMVVGGRFFGVFLTSTAAQLTNNLIFSGNHSRPQIVVQYTPGLSSGIARMSLHSNTIEYASCTGALPCDRVGLVVSGMIGGAVRNNVIRHVGIGGVTRPVEESDAAAGFSVFENNALFDPGALTGVYLDMGTTGLTTAAMINAQPGAAANQIVDCMLNASWHLLAASACRNTGTAMGAPDHDFDAQSRPREGTYDIGADEFVP